MSSQSTMEYFFSLNPLGAEVKRDVMGENQPTKKDRFTVLHKSISAQVKQYTKSTTVHWVSKPSLLRVDTLKITLATQQ